MPIIHTFEPNTLEFPLSEIKEYPFIREKIIVVNSISELPDDYIFRAEEFLIEDIDFSLYSLILSYDLQIGKVVSARYKWGYDISEDQYQMSIIYQITKDVDETEMATLIRNAIIVDHISNNADVQNFISVSWIEN